MSRINFTDQFNKSEWGHNFSYAGLARLYRELEELYNGKFEYDAGKIAAMYTEFRSLDEFNEDQFSHDKELYYESIEELENDRYIMHIDGGGFIVE
mgnify:CR=1 FL=1